eukprot:220574_1
MPVAVVTGASSGIGAAICKQFLESTTEQWKVIMIARTTSKMEEIATDCNAVIGKDVLIITYDVLQVENMIGTCMRPIKTWLKQLNMEYIDVLINNVGGFVDINKCSIEACELQDWTNTMHLNVTSAFLFTKHLLPFIHASRNLKYKSIVNMGSLCGDYGDDWMMSYAVSKAALHHFTKCAAVHCGAKYKNIRVNCISMSFVDTGLASKSVGNEAAEAIKQQYAERTPLRRIGRIDDIVNATQFLINSEKSGWITGRVITIDGGFTLKQMQSKY